MEYLFASLAGCIATTARTIANQKQLDLNGMDSLKAGAPVRIKTQLYLCTVSM
jgi:uncharacterized OsmC-like protein